MRLAPILAICLLGLMLSCAGERGFSGPARPRSEVGVVRGLAVILPKSGNTYAVEITAINGAQVYGNWKSPGRVVQLAPGRYELSVSGRVVAGSIAAVTLEAFRERSQQTVVVEVKGGGDYAIAFDPRSESYALIDAGALASKREARRRARITPAERIAGGTARSADAATRTADTATRSTNAATRTADTATRSTDAATRSTDTATRSADAAQESAGEAAQSSEAAEPSAVKKSLRRLLIRTQEPQAPDRFAPERGPKPIDQRRFLPCTEAVTGTPVGSLHSLDAGEHCILAEYVLVGAGTIASSRMLCAHPNPRLFVSAATLHGILEVETRRDAQQATGAPLRTWLYIGPDAKNPCP
jgi:hypothetical protein